MACPRSGLILAALLCLPLGSSRARAADGDAAAGLAKQALDLCVEGRKLTERDARNRDFERGQKLAEQAVTLDDQSADAHFALFCNMGELMRIDGESITSVFMLRRLMAEIDRTLELRPTHIDALAAKGTLLVRLPRLFGGDAEKGEAMLREVAERDPNALSTRITLARTCGQRGDRDEAVAFAERALQIARVQGRADKVAEAQAVLSELKAAE